MAKDWLFMGMILLAGIGIGWFVFDYIRRPPVPATNSYYAQQQPQYYIPPWVSAPQQYQPDHVKNDERINVEYNRDGSIKYLDVQRDVRIAN